MGKVDIESLSESDFFALMEEYFGVSKEQFIACAEGMTIDLAAMEELIHRLRAVTKDGFS